MNDSQANELNPFATPSVLDAIPLDEHTFFCREEMGVTRIGLNMLYGGIVLILLGLVVSILGGILLSSVDFLDRDTSAGPFLVSLVTGVATIVGIALLGLGQLLCIFVPAKTKARSLAITSFFSNLSAAGALIVCSLFSISLYTSAVSSAMNGSPAPTPGRAPTILFSVLLLSLLAAITGYFTFVFFLRRLAIVLPGAHRRRTASVLLVLGCITVVASLALAFIVLLAGADSTLPEPQFTTMAVPVLGLLLLVLAIAIVCTCSFLLRQLAQSINGLPSGNVSSHQPVTHNPGMKRRSDAQ